ncbi:MAG: outer membrane protein assembly factor BamE [Gammaproteobacteria bacterium]|jgi:outer membrane protein assembly factor BamE
MQTILIYLIASVVIFLAGCTIHIPDVQQGNVLEQNVLAQLHTGLSKKQVSFLMGTPIIRDVFHPDRWDYVYMLESQGKKTIRKRVTVFFDHDTVSRIETDDVDMPKAAPATKENPKG